MGDFLCFLNEHYIHSNITEIYAVVFIIIYLVGECQALEMKIQETMKKFVIQNSQDSEPLSGSLSHSILSSPHNYKHHQQSHFLKGA